jgi:hypothetical protein
MNVEREPRAPSLRALEIHSEAAYTSSVQSTTGVTSPVVCVCLCVCVCERERERERAREREA